MISNNSYSGEPLESFVRRMISQKGLEEALRQTAYRICPELETPFEAVERVMCVQPHPDDCEYGAGGLIADLSSRGVRVVYLTLTDGSMGTTDTAISPQNLAEIRRREQEEAASIMGVSKIVWLGYKDTELPYSLEARNQVLRVIREEKPDVVLAPDPWLLYEAHPDHRNAGLLASDAVMFSPLPHVLPAVKPHIIAMIAYYYTARPNYFHDVSNTLDRKLMALSRHRSQFQQVWAVFEEQVKALAAAYGQLAGKAYAEAFRVLPTSLIHATPLSELI